MDAETLKRIEMFLNEQDKTIETISRSRLEQLQKTDAAIQARLLKIRGAREILKTCSINVSVIAADSGISRKTFYNNDLLRLYVEKYARDPEESASASELQRLKAKTEQYREQVDAFLIRDIETENLRHENMKLTVEIANLQSRNKNLEEHYSALMKEMQVLKTRLAEQPGHIIPLHTSK